VTRPRFLLWYTQVEMGVALVRRQSLLLVLVGVLLGTVLAGVVLSRQGVAGPLAIRAGSLLAAPAEGVPARIDAGAPVAPGPLVTDALSRSSGPPAPTAPPADQVTVVPPPVYTYTEDHGGHHHGGGDGGGRS